MKHTKILALFTLMLALICAVGLTACGENTPPECETHSYGEWRETQAPTCTTAGEETHSCTVCGASETRPVDAVGHTYGDWVSDTPATCIAAGEEVRSCTVCGASETRPVDALGHTYGDWDIVIPAACEAEGLEVRTCAACGDKEEQSIVALGHDEVAHTAQAPTCTTPGWDAYVTCTRCDHTTYAEKAALGHDFSKDWDYTAEHHYHACTRTNCAEKDSMAEHVYDTELDESCNVCGAVHAVSCSHPTSGTVIGSPATCTTHGWTDGSKCTACGSVLVAQEIIPALGHNEVNHVAQAPTCTESGWDAYVTCSRCDHTTYAEKAALGHDEVAHTAQAPTCTVIGWDAYVSCSRCDYSTYVEQEPMGHNITGGWIMREDKHWHPCTNEGCEERRNEGAHVYTDQFDKNCNTCGYIREVAACTHPTTEPIVGYPATCTEPGLTDGAKCTVCGQTAVAQVPIGALGHDEIPHEAQAPTCEGIGWDAYVTCSRCDYSTYHEEHPLGHHPYYESGWQIEETLHYYRCKNVPCERRLEEAPHTPDDTGLCTVCGHRGEVMEFTFEKVDGGYAVTGYNGKDVTVEFPSTHKGEPVIAIKARAFQDKMTPTTFIIPDSVLRIEEYAFAGCSNLFVIKIGAGVAEIGDGAFDGCLRLHRVDFAEGSQLKTIGQQAFCSCPDLTGISLPEGLQTIGFAAFEKSNLVDMMIPASVIEIGDRAFKDSGAMYALHIANGSQLEKIGAQVFEGCLGIKIIFIPASVTEIGYRAFYDCRALEAVETEDGSGLILIDVEAFAECAQLQRVQFPVGLQHIAEHAFQRCRALKSFELPNTLVTIGKGAFLECDAVESISLPFIGDAAENPGETHLGYIFDQELWELYSARVPQGLRRVVITGGSVIPQNAFAGCTQIESVTIHAGVTEIGPWAFDNCTGLREVIFETGSSLSYIGDSAFAQCSVLTEISLPDGLKEIGIDAFFYMGLTSIHIPASVTVIHDGAFRGCEYLESVIFGENSSLTTIGADAFASDALRIIEIPASVTEIGTSAFHQFWGAIEKVYIEDIGKYCAISFGDGWSSPFCNGASLYLGGEPVEDLVIPAWIERISAFAFGGLNVEKISFEENSLLTTIGENAFSGCQAREIILPASVMRVEIGAFARCESLSSFTLYAMHPVDIARYAFEGTDGIKTISITTVAAESLSAEIARYGLNKLTTVYIIGGDVIGEELLYDCSSVTHVYIAASIERIEYGAFSGCPGLQQVDFEKNSGLYYIGSYAFYATDLTSIIIPSGVTEIGEAAFSGCRDLAEVTFAVGNKLTSIGKDAFRDCYALTTITIPAGVTDIGESAFHYSGLTSVTFEEKSQLTSIGASAFYGCTDLASIQYSGTVAEWDAISKGNDWDYSTGDYTVFGKEEPSVAGSQGLFYTINNDGQSYSVSVGTCSDADVVIPATYGGLPVTGISDRAFRGCKFVTSVFIPDSVTSIGTAAFTGCSNLVRINIPDGVTGLRYTFEDCHGLADVTFGENSRLTEIGQNAFFNCESLATITIPVGVTGIGTNAFWGCTSLASMHYAGTAAEWNAITKGSNWDYKTGSYTLHCKEVYSEGLTYTVDTGGWAYVSGIGTCADTDVIIPATYNGFPVTGIDNAAFSGRTRLVSVTIPASVTKIGTYAFSGCSSLQTVTFKEESRLTRVGDYAFDMCGALTGITLPNGVTEIGTYAFTYCRSLQTVTFGEGSWLTRVGDYAFNMCTALTGITLPDGVTAIGQGAFWGAGLTDITFGENSQLTEISPKIFYGCNALTSVTIPVGVTKIGANALRGCTGLVDLHYAGTTAEWNAITKGTNWDYNTGNYTLHCKVLYSEGIAYTFEGDSYTVSKIGTCTDTDIIIPETYEGYPVKKIGGSAFKDCTGFRSIQLPAGITTIDGNAFENCTGLTSIEIPAGVTDIGYYVFRGCTALESVTIPARVTRIYGDAFRNCTSLKSIVIPASVTRIYDHAFDGCTALESVTFAENSRLTRLEGTVFRGCTSLTSIVIPAGVTTLGSDTFDGCTSLMSVTFAENSQLTAFDSRLFRNCSSLTGITIPAGVTSIGNTVFYGCTSLESITIPKNVTSISGEVFYYCSSLASITVEEGNTVYHSSGNCLIHTANEYLLYGCKNSVIPSDGSVTKITYEAFRYCTELSSIVIPASVTSIMSGAFYGCTNLESITLPFTGGGSGSSRTHFGYIFGANYSTNNASYVPASLKEVIITDTTMIDEYAFEGCTGIERITIPTSVTKIEWYALKGCTGLTSVHYAGTMTEWEGISKSPVWDAETGAYTIYCSDGNITKS